MSMDKVRESVEKLECLQDTLRQIAEQQPEPFRTVILAGMKFRSTLTPETDRGCALMAAAYLDDRLKVLLQSRLVDDGKYVRRALDFSGALGTFSARINFAYLLGLIPKNAHRDLHNVRAIRNHFAHVSDALSFTDHKITEVCKRMYFDGVVQEAEPRSKFTRAVMGLLGVIDEAIYKAEHINAAPDHDITINQDGMMAARELIKKAGLPEITLPDFFPHPPRGS